MKKILGLLVGALVLFSVSVSAQTTLVARAGANATCIAQIPPYAWCDTVNVVDSNYTVPTADRVYLITCHVKGLVKFGLADRDSMSMYMDSFSMLPLNIKKIYKTGTDTALQHNGAIVLFGFKSGL